MKPYRHTRYVLAPVPGLQEFTRPHTLSTTTRLIAPLLPRRRMPLARRGAAQQ